MKRDANGVAVPHEADPLPWSRDANSRDHSPVDSRGVPLGLDGDTLDYQVHAANYHARLADIVRRLAEQVEPDWRLFAHQLQITLDASALWDEMKGGRG
jgi:hypothetical protein